MVASLQARNLQILSKYLDIDENDLNAVYIRGIFLGYTEQLLRILYRNTGNIPPIYRYEDFFQEIVITYVDAYCEVLLRPEIPDNLPELERDIAHIAIAKFFNNDYNIIDNLPPSCINLEKNWVRSMKRSIQTFGVDNVVLLCTLERVISDLWGRTIHFDVDSRFKPTMH